MSHPKVLISVGNFECHGAARLPEAFKSAGFEVRVICHLGSTLSYSSFVDRFILHRERSGAGYQAILLESINSWRPDLIVPGDETTLWLLHALRARLRKEEPDAPIHAAFDRSFCAFEQQGNIVLKSRLADIARQAGVRVPAQCVDPSPEAAIAFAEQHGFPVLIKHDRSSGGSGVHLCRTADELRRELTRDAAGLGGFSGARNLAVQQFVEGDTAMVGFAATGGRMIAGYAMRIVETFPNRFGPSSVLRHLDDPRLVEMAARIVGHFGFNGLGAADFRLAAGTGDPYLIEFNARSFANPHVGRYVGVDLCAALRASLEGTVYQPGPVVERRTIALFPNEWSRNPHSPHLLGCHDVPWHDRTLLQHLIADVGDRLHSLDVAPPLPRIRPATAQ